MEIKINRESCLLFVSSAEHCQSRTARWTAHVIGMYVSREQPIGLELNGPAPRNVFFFFRFDCQEFQNEWRQNTANIHVTQSLRLCGRISEKSVLISHFWKNTLQWRKHTPLQVFKNKYSTFQNLFLNVWTPVCRIPFTRFQNRATMKYTVRTVPDLKLCKCAGEIVWTLKMCWWKWWRS